MHSSLGRRVEPSAPRAIMPSLAIAGIGAALAVAAAMPAAAIASAPHHASSAHHVSSTHHNQHLVVKGLVAGHHGRTLTVFAKTTKVGAKTKHNQRIKVTFARSAHGRTKIPTGDHLRLAATGTASKHHFTIRHNNDETVTPAPATLIFGTVAAVNANLLTISENDRDNGDQHDGGQQDGAHHGGGGDDATPADHGPGGGDGSGDGHGDGHGHQITVDDTTAAITVDGAAGTIAVGDTVAVLGEATADTVVASTIYGFTTAPAFMRGEVNDVNGNIVTVRDNGDTSTVDLTGVPLALNGDVGSTPSQLVAGDELLVIGTLDSNTGQITPEVAFAFNQQDDHPCGDNNGHDGGGDGGSDG